MCLTFRRTGTSLYELLGLQKGATPDEVKKAYRRVGGAVSSEAGPLVEFMCLVFTCLPCESYHR